MLYSSLFGKTTRDVSADVTFKSHKFLHKAGFIRQMSAGRYAFLPLGYLVWAKIYKAIQAEMDALGCQQVITPTLHPIEFWKKTNRDEAFGNEMLVVKDHHGAIFAIGATAEGMMVELVKDFNPTYKDLPIVIYQFSDKFRDEKRPRGGLLRVREFMMKDAYTFAATESESLELYNKFYASYQKLAKHFGLNAVPALSHSGAIGGDYNHEFMINNANGEGFYYQCSSCGYAVTSDYVEQNHIDIKKCPKCNKETFAGHKAIEWGHVFKLDHFYSKAHEGYFVDKDGSKKLMWMGSYGIGIGRTIAAIAETHCDEKGLIWPKSVAPFTVYLTYVEPEFKEKVTKIYQNLIKQNVDVLFDDRAESVGVKFVDADLIGIPFRVVVSQKSEKAGGVEVKERGDSKTKIVTEKELLKIVTA